MLFYCEIKTVNFDFNNMLLSINLKTIIMMQLLHRSPYPPEKNMKGILFLSLLNKSFSVS